MLKSLLARLWSLMRSSAPLSPQDWVTVSISAILAVTLWFIVTLNTQTYTTDIEVPIRLVNFPGEYQLLDDFPRAVKLSVEGPGIKLLYEEYDNPDTLYIDYSSFTNMSHFVGHDNLELVSEFLQEGLKPLSVVPDSISLRKLPKKTKKVPVRLAMTWNLPVSFRLASAPKLSVDSVLVTGPSDSLERITYWPTAALLSAQTAQKTTFTVPMDTLSPYSVFPQEILVEISPEPFTEISVQVPVQAVGLPRFTELYFEPDTLQLRYLVPLAFSDSINARDFAIEVDFGRIDPRSDYVVPQIVRALPFVEVSGLYPQRVKYLVISKIK
jgi:YbbR domain-containing protein